MADGRIQTEDRKGKLNRRNMLKSIGSVSTISMASVSSATMSTTDRSVEIITHRSADGPEHRKKVPESWKENARVARDVRNQLLTDNTEVEVTSLIRSERQYGGKKRV